MTALSDTEWVVLICMISKAVLIGLYLYYYNKHIVLFCLCCGVTLSTPPVERQASIIQASVQIDSNTNWNSNIPVAIARPVIETEVLI